VEAHHYYLSPLTKVAGSNTDTFLIEPTCSSYLLLELANILGTCTVLLFLLRSC